ALTLASDIGRANVHRNGAGCSKPGSPPLTSRHAILASTSTIPGRARRRYFELHSTIVRGRGQTVRGDARDDHSELERRRRRRRFAGGDSALRVASAPTVRDTDG